MNRVIRVVGLAGLGISAILSIAPRAESRGGGGGEGGFWTPSAVQDCPRPSEPPLNDVCLDWVEQFEGSPIRLHSCCLTEADVGKASLGICSAFRLHDH